MNMDSGPRAGPRLMERAGFGIGYAAGGVALALLWTFEITTGAREAVRRRKTGPRPAPTPTG